MLRSPWLGVLALVVAGVIGYALSDGGAGAPRLESVTVTIRPTRDNGAAWDFGGGLPDPKITVQQGDTALATCEAKDQLKPTCAVHATLEQGTLRVVVVDVDQSDDDVVGELAIAPAATTTAGSGALQAVDLVTTGGGGAWARFRALWIALAIGLAIAVALALYRRRDA
ncbi:MAG: hypothetical protein M4D80_23490 [Myxococcota bacterium]|nr:hypothetical protein [Myxococcota bacterium]